MVTVDEFLARPLVAHLATAGPSVRPIWFLWDGDAFRRLTGDWSRLDQTLAGDPSVALVLNSCDLDTGEVLAVTVRGYPWIKGRIGWYGYVRSALRSFGTCPLSRPPTNRC